MSQSDRIQDTAAGEAMEPYMLAPLPTPEVAEMLRAMLPPVPCPAALPDAEAAAA